MIPKVAHFYWGGHTMPYMRCLTMKSFARYNPDWTIKLYVPRVKSQSLTWPTHEHRYDIHDEDCYGMLPEHYRIYVDISKIGGSDSWSEVHKSDLLRWWILSHEGGLWSDMDILYFAPIHEDLYSFDTGVCVNQKYGHSIGFLFACKDNAFYKDVSRLARLSYDARNYQCLGATLLNERFAQIRADYERIYNIEMDMVYPYDALNIGEIFSPGPLDMIGKRTIGLHWYAGHALAGAFQRGEISDCRLAEIMKKEGYDDIRTH